MTTTRRPTTRRSLSTRRSALAAAGVAAGAALLLAGCGGGTVVVQGPSGAVVSINPTGGASPAISISSSEGSIVVGQGLPSGWPAEVGSPEGFTVAAAATTKVQGKDAFTATFSAEGDQTAAVEAWLNGLVSNGFTRTAGIGGTAGSGGIAALESSTWKVTVITALSDGKTAAVVNVSPADA